MGRLIVRPFYTPHQLRHDQDDILFINEHWGEIKEAYFQVLEALKAPSVEQPSTPTPTPEGGCECTWVKKTFTPIYFYITLDDTAKELTDSEVEELIKYTDVSVLSSEGFSYSGNYGYENASASIPKQFPLIYLGKTTEGYKYAFPYPLADTQDTYYPDTGHTKCIYIQLHNILSKYNTDGSSVIHGLIKTNGTRIYRDSYGVGGKWPSTNKITLALASENYNIYPNLNWDYSLGSPPLQDTAKAYYYKHIANDIEATPMTFEFLETVRQCITEEEEKPEDPPEDTPDTPENDDNIPEDVITSYTLKAEFSPEWWLNDDPKFGVYCIDTETWKEGTKGDDGIVSYVFTEEEAISDRLWVFTRNELTEELSWNSTLNQTNDIKITFVDTVINDAQVIDADKTTLITVGKAYV
jgi:hypothetical protein